MIQVTADGSHTVIVPVLQSTYHSMQGAIQESRHVFIEAGLKPLLHSQNTIHILEIGLGTGLNALLSLQQAIQHQQEIYYYAIELYPLQEHEYKLLNYATLLKDKNLQLGFLQMHGCMFNEDVLIHPLFTLHKENSSLINFSTHQLFSLIFFDAFDPKTQPELWTKEIFEKMFSILHTDGVLVTYSSMGEVRRRMIAAGLLVEKLRGAAGKREMLRAIKK